MSIDVSPANAAAIEAWDGPHFERFVKYRHMDLGPAGEILRVQGDRAAHLHEPIRAALRDELGPLVRPGGVVSTASTWVVTARAPG